MMKLKETSEKLISQINFLKKYRLHFKLRYIFSNNGNSFSNPIFPKSNHSRRVCLATGSGQRMIIFYLSSKLHPQGV